MFFGQVAVQTIGIRLDRRISLIIPMKIGGFHQVGRIIGEVLAHLRANIGYFPPDYIIVGIVFIIHNTATGLRPGSGAILPIDNP